MISVRQVRPTDLQTPTVRPSTSYYSKSRLVRALRDQLTGEAHTPLSHFCSPLHTNSALYPVIGLLERGAGLRRDDPPDTRLDKLEVMLALATEDVHESIPVLADLLAIPTGERYRRLELSPHHKKERTFQVLQEQLQGLASRQPVLAIYEDVHWADPTTLELLDRVVEECRNSHSHRRHFSPGIRSPVDGIWVRDSALSEPAGTQTRHGRD